MYGFFVNSVVFRIIVPDKWNWRGKGVSTQRIIHCLFLQLYTVLRENTCGSNRNGSLVPKSKYLSALTWVWPRSLLVYLPAVNKKQELQEGRKWLGFLWAGLFLCFGLFFLSIFHSCVYSRANEERLICVSRPLILLLDFQLEMHAVPQKVEATCL